MAVVKIPGHVYRHLVRGRVRVWVEVGVRARVRVRVRVRPCVSSPPRRRGDPSTCV